MQNLPPHQRGSIAVMAALVISAVVILLASIDIGFLFYQKRELQKIADMAAIAGAQQLAKDNSSCASSITTATNNAGLAHHFSESSPTKSFEASCGTWDPVAKASPPHYARYEADPANPPNSIRVDVSESFGSFFGEWSSQEVHATAIAAISSPTAVFSVESRLLTIQDGTVPSLLAQLGVNINGTTLASYGGLANVKLTTGGLLAALGFNIPLNADVATIKSIVSLGSSACPNGICPINDLLGAMATVGGQEYLINALGVQTGQVKLLSNADGRGLLNILDVANGKSALDASIQAGELLSTAIIMANSDHPPIAGSLNTPFLSSELGITEPPSIGIGGMGTMAYTSQVRMLTKLNIVNGDTYPNYPTAKILTLSNFGVVTDLASGSGKIEDLCTKKKDGKDVATISVKAPLVKLCIGDFTATNTFSTSLSCSDQLPDVGKSTLGILPDIGLLNLQTKLAIDALPTPGPGDDPSAYVHDFVLGEEHTFPANNLAIGTTISNLMDALLASILNGLFVQGQSSINNNNVAAGLLNATGNSLQGSIDLVKDSLNSLSNFVGGLDSGVTALLSNASIFPLLESVGSLIDGLLNNLGKFLNTLLTCGIFPTDQCKLASDLQGGQPVSKALITVLGLVTKQLVPFLDKLGSDLAAELTEQLGVNIGQVSVRLIDLNCGGGENVRLVH